MKRSENLFREPGPTRKNWGGESVWFNQSLTNIQLWGTFLTAMALIVVTAHGNESAPSHFPESAWLSDVQSAIDNEESRVLIGLLRQGNDLARFLPDDSTILHHAGGSGFLDVTLFLLDTGVDPNPIDSNGNTPLHLAAQSNQADCAHWLLAYGGRSDFKNKEGRTALHLACLGGDIVRTSSRIVRELLEMGAEVNVLDNEGDSPLDKALQVGDEESVAVLLQFNGALGRRPIPALYEAVISGDTARVTTLLNGGESFEKALLHGDSALHTAARLGRTDIVRTFAKHGADMAQISDNGFTPLHLAAAHGQTDTVIALVDEFGANLELGDTAGRTPLFLAVDNNHLTTVQALAERGSNLKIELGPAVNPMLLAAINENLAMWNLLKALRAPVDNIHAAVAIGDGEAVIALLAQGWDINDVYANRWTPLHVAAEFDNPEMARLLLQSGAEVDRPMDCGLLTPLHQAALHGALGTAMVLLEFGADPNALTARFETALTLARMNKDAPMEQLLRSYGGTE